MSSLCCCRGLLSLFGVRGYPLDVVAQSKMDKAKANRARHNDYSTMTNDGESQNGSVVRSEPHNLSDVSGASTAISADKRPKRKPSSRRSHRSVRSQRSRRSERSFDDADSDSSVDSTEENLRTIRKTIRKSQSRSVTRDTLASVGREPLDAVDGSHFSPAPSAGSPAASPRVAHPSPPPSTLERGYNGVEEHDLAAEDQSKYQRATIAGPEMPTTVEGAAGSTYGDEHPTIPEGAKPKARSTVGSTREFQRKAIRKSPKSSPSLSVRSGRSLSPTYASSKWEMEEAGSLYQERQLAMMGRESEEDELAMAQEASRTAERTLGDFEDDEEIDGHGFEPISACGTLDVAVQYSLSERKLQVTVIEAHDLPSKARGGSSIVQVRAVLLPAKKKKYKTKVQHISSPRFAETFKLSRAAPEDLRGLALRLRMYGIGKIKDRLIGEAVLRFDELNLIRDPQLTIQLQLEPRTDINRGDSDTTLSYVDSRSSSMMSLSHGGSPPELLIGLSYNAPTGRLCVEVIKGSHFRNLAMARPPDTFVKLSLLNSACQEVSQSKTTIRRGQPNPVYKESFFFQVALFQLGEVTLMVSVYNKRTIKKKEMIGWVSMGRNSSSDVDEQHWHEMKDGKGQQVSRWHTLVDT